MYRDRGTMGQPTTVRISESFFCPPANTRQRRRLCLHPGSSKYMGKILSKLRSETSNLGPETPLVRILESGSL